MEVNILKNLFSRKLVAIGVGVLVIGSVVTAGVFAAIPDSGTGRITACRNNNSGALKVIDAQNGGHHGPGVVVTPASIEGANHVDLICGLGYNAFVPVNFEIQQIFFSE